LAATFAILYTAAAVTLTLLSLGALPPQQIYAQSQTQSSRELSKADIQARQRALWGLERMKWRLSERPTEPRLAYQQIKEDHEQLQVLTYHLSEAAGAGPTLDYKQIRKDAAEVKKHATRLKINLSLPEPGKSEKPKQNGEGFSTEELKSAIEALNALVKSFVWNPIFQQPNVVDVEHLARARRDLEGIIRLSEQIQKRAEALSKAGKNF
jgi:hypothetical protein